MLKTEEEQKVKFLRVKFYWEEGSFIFYIKRKDGGYFTAKEIDNLLKKYKEEDEFYNDMDWEDFLEGKGFSVERVDYDYSIYF